MSNDAEPFGPFLERWTRTSGEVRLFFRCPGCGNIHCYWLAHGYGTQGPIWDFNGNSEQPSFNPSLRVRGVSRTGEEYICHLYVTDGQIRYCDDSTHEFAGKTLPMEVYR